MISLTLIDVDFERHPSIEHIAVMLDTEIRFLSPSSWSSIVTISSINVFQSIQITHENTLAMQMTCIQCLWQHIHSTNINKFDLTRKKTPFSQIIYHTIIVHQLISATKKKCAIHEDAATITQLEKCPHWRNLSLSVHKCTMGENFANDILVQFRFSHDFVVAVVVDDFAVITSFAHSQSLSPDFAKCKQLNGSVHASLCCDQSIWLDDVWGRSQHNHRIEL